MIGKSYKRVRSDRSTLSGFLYVNSKGMTRNTPENKRPSVTVCGRMIEVIYSKMYLRLSVMQESVPEVEVHIKIPIRGQNCRV